MSSTNGVAVPRVPRLTPCRLRTESLPRPTSAPLPAVAECRGTGPSLVNRAGGVRGAGTTCHIAFPHSLCSYSMRRGQLARRRATHRGHARGRRATPRAKSCVDDSCVDEVAKPAILPEPSQARRTKPEPPVGLLRSAGSPPRRRPRDERWPPCDRAARRAPVRFRPGIRPLSSPLPSWPSGPYWRLPAGAWRAKDGALRRNATEPTGPSPGDRRGFFIVAGSECPDRRRDPRRKRGPWR